ncbi:MAG: LamG-like jellyroll fold domain-containing protein [Psychroserpens sp.]|uniref:LamG-like jellyroll fold domain-containing protein n=1 Tax=Psychroserpens sp. TaxID=2020870 RepID=UPI0030031B54
MKTKLLIGILTFLCATNISLAQNSKLQINVRWPSNSYENKVEVYNTAHDLITTVCDNSQCYSETQIDLQDRYGSKYNLGCVTNGNNYYIKMYDIANDGWSSDSHVKVYVAGVEVINDDGSGANSSGETIYFNVTGGDVGCNSELDTDSDGIADYLDYDDDGDGITDAAENLGQDRFECTLPPLEFENGTYDAGASTASAGNVGAVYRFSNAIQGYDVLMEIMELTNATVANIDNDTIDNPTYLQTELNLTGTGTPGATFQFTIVDADTTTPSTEIFRINGITWDCDGTSDLQESVIYYNPAAYGIENPSDLVINDLGSNNIEITSGDITVNGFSTLPWLRAYYQFIGNSFSMRMQAFKTTTRTRLRQFGMSFTQCEFLDFNANSLVIITGEDFDGDGDYNHLDLDSDNDGIPDNVEGQSTLGYLAPSMNVNVKTGIDVVYGTGIDVVNTDNDKYPDVLDLDTDNDGLPDIEENGMANTIVTFADSDSDGLDDLFEGSNLSDPLDANDEINTPSSSILPDLDGDVFSGGDVDYRDLFNTNPPPSATLDFDGVDDYLATDSFIDGKDEVTIMAWVKIASGNSGYITIAGEDVSCKLYLQNGKEPCFSIKTDGNATSVVSSNALIINEWHHISGTYSNATGMLRIFVDGKQENELDTGITSDKIKMTSDSNGAFEVGRVSSNVTDREYFKGEIDEVRVFDIDLTKDQIQRMVYQEIENSSGNVRGTIIGKDIVDITSNATIPWVNLIAYFPMTDIKNSTTTDFSNNSNTLRLNNITTFQGQTAPMPYRATSNGNWSTEGTWLHGDVWDIETVNINKDWSIVKIESNVTTSSSHKNLGLIIDENKSLTVNGDQQINNSWYLELDGTLELNNDSQLIQGINSDLVTSANGKIRRRQEGNTSVYWYNYWASPVGAQSATTLLDNNASTNNVNNSIFTLNTLKEGNENSVQFTASYNEVGKISTRWLYSYKNGLNYYQWASLAPTSAIEPGVGYTQKGTGNTGAQQQYIFEGKPNNGTIIIPVNDIGGAGSVPSVSKTDYLLGNPYPSALDIYQFIDDNESVIDGTLQLWQQWSGTSHNLDEYDGGYAQVNKLGSIRAYQFVGEEGATNGSQDGTVTPSKYLPVGQGFMTEIVNSGDIVFNNGQRVFIKEADADGTYNNGSSFFRLSETDQEDTVENTEDIMQKIRLEFNAVTGPVTRRELLLGFSNFTSDAYDYGYDAKNTDVLANDLNLILEDQNMLMQAYASISANKVVPLNLTTSGDYTYEIKITEIEYIAEDQEIYLKDNLTGTYFDLKNDQAYGFSSEEGEFNNRFEIVFQTEASLSTEEDDYQYNLIYFNNDSDKLFVKGLQTDVKQLMVINILGQSVREYTSVSSQDLENGLEISNLSTGTYVVYLKTANVVKTKKILIN